MVTNVGWPKKWLCDDGDRDGEVWEGGKGGSTKKKEEILDFIIPKMMCSTWKTQNVLR